MKMFGKKNKKKILIITPYFFPENFPINKFVDEVEKFDFEIEILTSFPNYRNYGYYKNYTIFKGPYIEKYKNSKIFRLPVIPRLSNSFFSIFFFYSSFFFLSLIFISFFGIINRNKYLHVMTFCGSPVYVGFLGSFFAKLSNSTSSQWIQDIWPEAIITSFGLKKNYFFKFVDSIQTLMWKSSHILFSQSRILEKYLKSEINNVKIVTLNNPARENIKNFEIYKKKFSNKHIIISYFGNIGKTQNLEYFINNIIKINLKNIIFNVCGDGGELNYLRRKYIQDNIVFHGWLNAEKMQEVAKKTDFFYLSLKDQGRQNYIIPSKFQTYLGYAKPVIFIGNEQICNLILKNNLGFAIPNSLANSIYKTLLNLQFINELHYDNFQNSVIKYYLSNYNSQLIAKKFINTIQEYDI